MWIEHTTAKSSFSFPDRPLYLAGVLLLVLLQPILQGCGPTLVAGAAVGASVVHDRRDAATVIDDQQIEVQAMLERFNDSELRQRSDISITSFNRVVLLTGQVQSPELSERFAERVSRLPKVKRVVNELSVGPDASLTRQGEDTLITSRVKLSLTGIDRPGFDPTRVKVVTEMGIVYLMGLLSSEEADAVVEKARYVPGVSKVIKIFEYVEPTPAAA